MAFEADPRLRLRQIGSSDLAGTSARLGGTGFPFPKATEALPRGAGPFGDGMWVGADIPLPPIVPLSPNNSGLNRRRFCSMVS